MWKAVIADDEGVILQGLKKLVDWTNMDVHLVGEARDGQQLKEVMEETDPDIVITDIMMPYRTGLDILRWCNEADMHAKFIFISGYQEFTYAKEALQSGAVDYLLKPVARKDLEDAKIASRPSEINNSLLTQIATTSTIKEYPQELVDYAANNMKNYYKQQAESSSNKSRWNRYPLYNYDWRKTDLSLRRRGSVVC